MAKIVKVPRPRVAKCKEEKQVEQIKKGNSQETGEKLKAEIDDLLDAIDEVLEEEAEDFVKSYVQKGGE